MEREYVRENEIEEEGKQERERGSEKGRKEEMRRFAFWDN
jgi:hypothetical protein